LKFFRSNAATLALAYDISLGKRHLASRQNPANLIEREWPQCQGTQYDKTKVFSELEYRELDFNKA
jgi:hypothetical protein